MRDAAAVARTTKLLLGVSAVVASRDKGASARITSAAARRMAAGSFDTAAASDSAASRDTLSNHGSATAAVGQVNPGTTAASAGTRGSVAGEDEVHPTTS